MDEKELSSILDGESDKSVIYQVWVIFKSLVAFVWIIGKFIIKNVPAALGMLWEKRIEMGDGLIEGLEEAQVRQEKRKKLVKKEFDEKFMQIILKEDN